MSHIAIGVWVRRPLGNVTKWHLVESIVDEDAITRCGRRMDRENANGELQVSEVMPLTRAIGQPQLCKAGCARLWEPLETLEATTPQEFLSAELEKSFARGEDDGSTAPVEAGDVAT